jgi:SAM-dependent methyltransferase
VYKKIFRPFYYYLGGELKNCNTVLDLGCGKNSPIKYCSIPYSVGIELFGQDLKVSEDKKIHNEYILGNITKIEFKDNSFDCVCAIDVLEHLTKEEGGILIKKMERIAKKKIIIFTPNGFLPQTEHDGNILQIHKCGWTVQDFKELGFIVKGINGIKFLRKEEAALKFKPTMFFMIISDVTQKLTHSLLPCLAFQLLCIKNVEVANYELRT